VTSGIARVDVEARARNYLTESGDPTLKGSDSRVSIVWSMHCIKYIVDLILTYFELIVSRQDTVALYNNHSLATVRLVTGIASMNQLNRRGELRLHVSFQNTRGCDQFQELKSRKIDAYLIAETWNIGYFQYTLDERHYFGSCTAQTLIPVPLPLLRIITLPTKSNRTGKQS
jgi:hypothetical protein